MTGFDTDLLDELIERKLACLRQLEEVGEAQLHLVRHGGMTELLDVLGVKQRLLRDLQAIERSLGPFRNQDPDERRWPSPAARQRCAQHIDQCEVLLSHIVAREKESERELIRRRDQAAAQLEGTHRAQQARQAYAAQSPGRSGLDITWEG